MTIDDTVPMRLRCAYLMMHRAAQAHFSELGVTADQYVLLSVLTERDGVTQTWIADRMASDANTITAMLRLLEQKELIGRKRCETDGRARRVHLTASGRQLHRKLVRIADRVRGPVDQALSTSDRKTLFSLLDRITNAISEHGLPEQSSASGRASA